MSVETAPTVNSPMPGMVPAALRGDLIRREQTYLGRRYLVFKNPIGLSYYRLPLAHAEAAEKFDGTKTFAAVWAELRVANRYWKALPEERALGELYALAQQLASSGLLRVKGGSAVARAKQLKKFKQSRWFEISMGHVLYFRKSLFDPDGLLTTMVPWFRWAFTRTALVLTLALFAVTLFAIFRHWDSIATQSVNFFTIENLALTWVIFFGVKIIHEFGHGVTCKRFGGEVHEMGFMFILFTPYLFCNVSDSWLADKRARIAVTSAGIFVELVIACAATWLWLVLQPGLLKQMCLNTMILCSVSTVLFNANPLLKFDGYYILTDLLEIPNLKQKSNTYVTQWAQRVFLGIRQARSRLMAFELNPLFGIYAVLSYLYGWFIVYNISLLMFDKLKPFGLEVLSRTYVGLFLFTSVALPIYRLARSVKNTENLRSAATTRLRWLGLIFLCLLGLMFVIPWQNTIKRMTVIEHLKVEPIAPLYPGFLRQLHVRDGEYVEAGQPIADLQNVDLELEKKDLELQIQLSEVKYRAAITSERADQQQLASAQKKMTEELREELKGVDARLAFLKLTAPRDGIIRTRDLANLSGRYFAKGQLICEIGEHGNLRAIIPLNEREAKRVHAGQKVVFRLLAEPQERIEGVISALPVSPLPHFTSPSLANLYGGDVPAEQDTQNPKAQIKPSLPHYEAEVSFVTTDPDLRPGMVGKARIYTGWTTLGFWIIERMLDFLDPEFRL